MTLNMHDARRRFIEAQTAAGIARARHTHMTYLVEQTSPLDPDYMQLITGWEDMTMEVIALELEVKAAKVAITDLNTAERAAKAARHAASPPKPHGRSVHKGLKLLGWVTMLAAICSGHHTGHHHP